MSKAWAKGSTYAWRRTRAQILADNVANNRGRCTLGTGACTGAAEEVHHTRGRNVTGDDPKYLAAVCRACNLAVGDPAGLHTQPDPRPTSTW